jgi:hypothetical protein
MKYCTNCGNKINEENKFCPNCGTKNNISNSSTNKIDESIEKVVTEVNAVKKEFSESKYINQTKEVTKNTLYNLKKYSILILGYIGLFITTIQLVNFYFFDKKWYIAEAYYHHFPNKFNLSEFPFFISEILIIILSLCFMLLLGKRKKWILFIASFYIAIFLFTSIKTINSDNNKNEALEIKDTLNKNDVKLSANYNYKENNYNYSFSNDQNGYNKNLKIYRNNELFFEYDFKEIEPYIGKVEKIENDYFFNNYFYFECLSTKKTEHGYGLDYYVLINIVTKQKFILKNMFWLDSDRINWTHTNLNEFKDIDYEVYNIFLNKKP